MVGIKPRRAISSRLSNLSTQPLTAVMYTAVDSLNLCNKWRDVFSRKRLVQVEIPCQNTEVQVGTLKEKFD